MTRAEKGKAAGIVDNKGQVRQPYQAIDVKPDEMLLVAFSNRNNGALVKQPHGYPSEVVCRVGI